MPQTKTTRPSTGRVIDLDAARTARAEVSGEPVVLRFGGRDFTLPPEMPLDFAFHASQGDLREAVATLLAPKDVKAFLALRPSFEDYGALVDGATRVYGTDAGESPASPSS